MVDLARVQELVERAIDAFDDPTQLTSTHLRRCLRIATLRNDTEALLWLELEAGGITSADKERSRRRRQELLAHMDAGGADELVVQVARRSFARRTVEGQTDAMYPDSVSGFETRIQGMRDQIEGFALPDGLHPVDLYHRSIGLSQARLEAVAGIQRFQQILDSINNDLHRFLIETEAQLEFGNVNSAIFERTRSFVDEQLQTLAPAALEQFRAAYKRVREGDPEALSQALTSCRRILKTVADLVCPPRPPAVGADGGTHPLTDANYINRLLHFVQTETGGHGSADVVQATIEGLADRLSALDSLASKGVHDSVTATEVDTCVVQTYLMIGEILRHKTGTAPGPEVTAPIDRQAAPIPPDPPPP